MGTQRHVILRQTVEFDIAREEDAWPLQQEVSRIMRGAQTLVERCCDELSRPDRLHRIERLELDLGLLDPHRLEEQLLGKLGQALHLGLAEQIRRQDSAIIPARLASQLELFSQFARFGTLPWWADLSQSGQPAESLDLLLREAPGLLAQLLKELVGEPPALQRLAAHFDDRRLAALVLLIAPALADLPMDLCRILLTLPKHLLALANTPNSRLRNQIWQSILAQAALSPTPPSDPVGFTCAVLMYLSRLQALPYASLAHGFSLAACADSLRGPACEVAAAMEAGYGPTNPAQTRFHTEDKMAHGDEAGATGLAPEGEPPKLADSSPHVEGHGPPARLGGSEAQEAALAALGLWMQPGGQPPAWLSSWPKPLQDALYARLDEMKGASALGQLRLWLEQGAEEPAPAWLQSWPGLLREEFVFQLWELGQSPASLGAVHQAALAPLEAGKTNHPKHEAFLPPLTNAVDKADAYPSFQEESGFSDADLIHLGNAGLVILWPFIKTFFDRLGLLEESRFIGNAARQRGVTLLQYLAAEDAAPPEFLLPLNKVLCGVKPEWVYEPETTLNEEEIAECNGLLEAVIASAPILNNMSIGGFRGSFLLRAGVLEVRDGAWLLRVERETYDLVLDRFPWGFSWVKLPWMEFPLQVEW